ncbi:PIN domain-containing protein [Leucobacter manosquensis]|uniref:PIN domain-containing protein n=1 Tax=Leucobacter manosquensis TaxID=2810611 RepID=A0ABS5M6R0_9MICO|nr:PIN domain-containing protein [Leucobacter manosquensis]MBS3182892.1 PIN domain-containing protein [Leucobacter manosquensis]
MTARSEELDRSYWYLDTSVALRILLGHSQSAIDWYDNLADRRATFVSSRILELEMKRVLRRESIAVDGADEFLSELALLAVDNRLITEAAAIRPHIKSLDALHLASAQRIGAGNVTIVTHDANMTTVADSLGFDVVDPVN